MIKKLIKSLLNHHLYDTILGKKEYGKFVVISRSRTGSNLLVSFLNNHRKIRAFGEKFVYLHNRDTNSIYNEIFRKKSTKITGFKLFYYHPLDSDDRSIWELLKNDQSIKIIHLRRRNALRAYLSQKIAQNTKVWVNSGDNNVATDTKKVHLDIDEMFKDFEDTNNDINQTKSTFDEHQMIEVFYEDLIQDRIETMNRIFDFLNVSRIQVKTTMKKQNPEKIKDLVINYDALKEKLINSEYSFMLEE